MPFVNHVDSVCVCLNAFYMFVCIHCCERAGILLYRLKRLEQDFTRRDFRKVEISRPADNPFNCVLFHRIQAVIAQKRARVGGRFVTLRLGVT